MVSVTADVSWQVHSPAGMLRWSSISQVCVRTSYNN